MRVAEGISIQDSHFLLELLRDILGRVIQRQNDIGDLRVELAALVEGLLLTWVVRLQAREDGNVSLLHEGVEAQGSTSLLLHSLIVESGHGHVHRGHVH